MADTCQVLMVICDREAEEAEPGIGCIQQRMACSLMRGHDGPHQFFRTDWETASGSHEQDIARDLDDARAQVDWYRRRARAWKASARQSRTLAKIWHLYVEELRR